MDIRARCGWAPGLGLYPMARMHDEIDAYHERGVIVPFKLARRTRATDEVRQAFSWDDCAKVGVAYPLAPPLDNQEIGDCVSWGITCVGNLLQVSEIAMGERSKFHPLFPPYSYWASRMTDEGGRGQLGGEDGSLGSWAAAATAVWGFLRADFPNCPAYNGRVAKQWGSARTIASEFTTDGRQHGCKVIGQITSMDQLLDALRNRYWCTIASNRGFSMQLQESEGRGWFTGNDNWPHQMAYVGIDMDVEGIFDMNSWGPNAHGHQSLGFQGGGWVKFKTVEKILATRDAECFTLSRHQGYDEEPFPEVPWAQPADIP